MSDAMKAPHHIEQSQEPSLKHQIEDVLRDTKTLNGLRIEGLNHKVTAFTRAPLLLEQALAEIIKLEQCKGADLVRGHSLLAPALAELSELDKQRVRAQQQPQFVAQLEDATAQCGAMADLLRTARKYYDTALENGDFSESSDIEYLVNQIDEIDAVLAGQLPTVPSVTLTEVIRTAPERIWLQIGDEQHYSSEPFPNNTESVTWCRDSVTGCEVPYVRADLLTLLDLATPSFDLVRSQLNSRSVHTLMALADILEREEAKGLILPADGKIYVATSVLRSMAAELPDAWRMMCGDWREDLVALHGPDGHIASGLTVAQATALIEAHGGSQVWAIAAASAGGAS